MPIDKKELDRLTNDYHKVLRDLATREISKFKRRYTSDDVLSCLYLDLLGKLDRLKPKTYHNYSKQWIRTQVRFDTSPLNCKEIKIETYFDNGQDCTQPEQSPFEEYLAKLEGVKVETPHLQKVINDILEDENDHTNKTLAKKYNISVYMMNKIIKRINNEIKQSKNG